MNLKQELVDHLIYNGAFDVRVADPSRRFEHGIPKRHPLKIWPDCRSIVVFVMARPAELNNTYSGPLRPKAEPVGIGMIPHYMIDENYALDRMCDLYSTRNSLPRRVFPPGSRLSDRTTTRHSAEDVRLRSRYRGLWPLRRDPAPRPRQPLPALNHSHRGRTRTRWTPSRLRAMYQLPTLCAGLSGRRL